MKALIYNPYLDTLGGGERYCLTVAEYFLKRDWEVDLFWNDESLIKKAIERFDLGISGLKVLGKKPEDFSTWGLLKVIRKYDFVFWLSDGSIPFLLGKKIFLHFQRPFKDIGGKGLLNKFKLSIINQVICNSFFTKKFIDQEFGVNSVVLYPPVDIEKFKPSSKKNVILAIGRFEEYLRAKRQDVLVKSFKEMVDEGLRGWRLVLIGASLSAPPQNQFLQKLKRSAKGYPIDFLVNVPFSVISRYCSFSKIFWHAAGFGINEQENPWLMEHFGITLVEAMAAGCVPVVIGKGGLKEIVRHGEGLRWKNIFEMKSFTKKLITNSKLYLKYQEAAISRSSFFSKSNFYRRLEKLLNH